MLNGLNCGCKRVAYTQSLLAIINEKFGDVRGAGAEVMEVARARSRVPIILIKAFG